MSKTTRRREVPAAFSDSPKERETAIRVYYTGKAIKGITALFDDDDVDIVTGRSNGMNFVEIPNIPAKHLDDYYVVDFGTYGTVTVNGLSYCYLVLKYYQNDPDYSDLVSTVKAVYEYNRAAEAFFGGNS